MNVGIELWRRFGYLGLFSSPLRKSCMARGLLGASSFSGLIADCVSRYYGWRLAMHSNMRGFLESKDKAPMAIVWKGRELK